MLIDDKIKDEKLQQDVNREAAKISVSSSDKFDKYEYLIDEEALLSGLSRIIEQANFIYFPIGKAFEKHIKTIEDQLIKEVEVL